jgi:hypothetical protein
MWIALILCLNAQVCTPTGLVAMDYPTFNTLVQCQQRIADWLDPHGAVPERDFIKRCVKGPEYPRTDPPHWSVRPDNSSWHGVGE